MATSRRWAAAVLGVLAAAGAVVMAVAPSSYAVTGETQWADGSSGSRATSETMPSVTVQAKGVRPNAGYEPLSGKNGCTTHLRSAGSATTPYVVVSDDAGNIRPTAVLVHEGGNPRPAGTYDLCFRSTNPADNSYTDPIQLTVGSTMSPPAIVANHKGTAQWPDGSTGSRATSETMPVVRAQATGVRPNAGYEPLSGKNDCTTDLRSTGSATTPYVVVADDLGNIRPTAVLVHEGGKPRPAGTYDVCFRSTDPADNSYTSPVQLAVASTLAPPAIIVNDKGTAQWPDGSTDQRVTGETMPRVTVQAKGVRPSTGYEPLSGRNGCTSDLRGTGSATTPYVVVSDALGNIGPTAVLVHEGGNPRPPGTYDLCFRSTNPADNSYTSSVRLSIGGTCTIDPENGQAAITAAIASCPDGSRVQFPAGRTYQATGPIRIDDRNDLTIDGNGSTFITSSSSRRPGSGNWVVLRGNNITFTNMTVRGAFNLRPNDCGPTWSSTCRVYDLSRYPAGIGWEANQAWAFFGTNGGGVRDAQAFDLWGDGVMTAFDGILDPAVPQASWQVARNLVVERILVENASRVCIAPVQAINVTFRDSTYRHCWTWGVDAEADADHDGNLDNALPIDGLRILNNTFEGYSYGAIAVPVGGDPDTLVGNIEVRSNRLDTGPTQAPCQASILMGVEKYSNRIKNVVVDGNTIKGLSRFVVYQHVDGGTITNNVFVHQSYGAAPSDDPSVQCSASPGTPVAPVVVNDSKNVTESGNSGP